ncbi:hypothetical protein [Lichenibacterium ramalinae]|uniref:Bacteriocin n=1 Tax=Lichenibacterium ramalinae TaxID=2316527 RepID=A0A4Q2RAJ4_9HYPH|nr:hypothetical protein [Lichenibacterium ramalinae]RYB02596.1 hypothetical protein D3272_20375 [Lichenibacterium ramalinae]
MRTQLVLVASLLGLLALPAQADAQGIVGGARTGAARGERAAGPVGGVVGGVLGGAVGGVVGGARGVLGLPRRGAHHVVRHHRRHRR